jgi:hypothetical protein
MRGVSLVAMVALAFVAAACGDETPTSPSSATTTSTSTVTFAGTLSVGGARFYSFTNLESGSVTALLASVAGVDTRMPLAVPLEIGIGIPAGTGCATSLTQLMSPALISQMTVTLAAGTFCLRVADAGELRVPVSFAVRFTHP